MFKKFIQLYKSKLQHNLFFVFILIVYKITQNNKKKILICNFNSLFLKIIMLNEGQLNTNNLHLLQGY